ncbi:hypothetical protein VF21_02105 [Pseudogymnoascus sp. 05NY08]|nr:hypothetical protein VF21_01967 [Pseudogymnoascus sp. 05NY08]OBT79446.1 hypothetical protein VF21_02105 [Pseudogymnoascus sp. 05NY08]
MALLHPNDKPTLLKRPSDGDIGGDLRNNEMKKHMRGSMDEMRKHRDLYPDYDPTTAQKLNETQSAIKGWLASAKKLKETENIWEAQDIVNELLKSINKSGYDLLKMARERKEFDVNKRINRMTDSSQSQSTTVKQNHLFNFDLLLEKFKQLRNIVEEAGTQLLRKGHCDIEDIMTKLEEARSVIPDAAPSQDIPTRFKSRAVDVPAYKHDRISPNDRLQNAINSELERGKVDVDKLECAAALCQLCQRTKSPRNDKDAVAMWKFAISLLTTQSGQLILDDDSEV